MSHYPPNPTGWPPPPQQHNGYELQLASMLGQLMERTAQTIIILERIDRGIGELTVAIKATVITPPPAPFPPHHTSTRTDTQQAMDRTAGVLQRGLEILQTIGAIRATMWPWMAMGMAGVYKALEWGHWLLKWLLA
jgi:hypothetical protein